MLDYINKLNRSKYFLGVLIIFLNLGSKFITIRMNDFHERVLRDTVGRELMIFAICFVGTRDILASILMSSLFIILNDYLFDENSDYCIIPRKYRQKIKSAIDTNKDNIITESEIERAVNILNKAQKQKEKKIQRNAYMTFMNNL
ncbi:MAG: hypothetical protein ACR2M6_03240 [Vampirovibrionia bacterium]|jgi:hypothetical protein